MTDAACAICTRPVAGSERMIVLDGDINGITHVVCFRERERATRELESGSASRAEADVPTLEEWIEEMRKDLATARARHADEKAGTSIVTIYQGVSRHVSRALGVASRYRLHGRLGA